jgi:hypothetical protein
MAEWTPRTRLVCRDIEHTVDGIEAEFEVGGLVEFLVPFLVPALIENDELMTGLVNAVWGNQAFQDAVVTTAKDVIEGREQLIELYARFIGALTDDEYFDLLERAHRDDPEDPNDPPATHP